MASGVEAEFKVRIDGAGYRSLSQLSELDGCRIARSPDKRQTTTYFDTPDLALRKAGMALRLRRSGRSGEQTVKIGGSFSLGLAARPEYTVAHVGRVPAIAKFVEPEVRAALSAVVDGRPLLPLFSMRMLRKTWVCELPDGGRVEMVLDRGIVTAGERRSEIVEAEFELVDGDPRAVFEVAKAALSGVAFELSNRTKSDVGYDLIDDRPDDRGEPLFAETIRLDADRTVEEALRTVLRSCAVQIAGNVAAVRKSRDPEGAHQLRVGLRRLRSALAVFGRVIAPEQVMRLKDDARWLAAAVGSVRDLDVLIDELVVPLSAAADMAPLVAVLEKKRTVAHGRLAAVMAERRTGDFLVDLIAFVEGRGWLSSTDIAQSALLSAPVEGYASRAIERLRRKVTRLGKDPESLTIETRHELRKKFKVLRYGLDFFDAVLDKPARKKLLPAVKAAQEVLGVLNDIAMAHAMLDGLVVKGGAPGLERATGFCLGWHAARADAIWKNKADDLTVD
jgi:inorganic triphosphatase YgiF